MFKLKFVDIFHINNFAFYIRYFGQISLINELVFSFLFLIKYTKAHQMTDRMEKTPFSDLGDHETWTFVEKILRVCQI